MMEFTYIAIATYDYINISLNQTFATESTNGAANCVSISIVDDDALEGNETFAVELATLDRDVIIMNNKTTIIITDNDG